ncbi:MAG: hypothetical protein H0T42_23360 [Deltaproteobacteria bacterium]|nr:hypothetical protein [Deltaproteobacteria bacterium]
MRRAPWLALTALSGLAACSSSKPRTPEDAKRVTAPADAAIAPTDGPPAPKPPFGDVQVRVEWTNVPPAARSSPGKTACGTPRAPAVAPTTTWGIPDVIVLVDGAPGALAEARVRLVDCSLSPRIAIGSALLIDSAADRPAQVVLSHRARASDLRVEIKSAIPARTIQLPIAGHAVSAKLADDAVFELTMDKGDPAWIVAAHAAVTDPSGVVLVREVPPGVHAVRAWLPPRGDQPARHAAGQVTVVDGDLAELTLQLVP